MAVLERIPFDDGDSAHAATTDNSTTVYYVVTEDAVSIRRVVPEVGDLLDYPLEQVYTRQDVLSDFDELARLEGKPFVELGASKFEMLD